MNNKELKLLEDLNKKYGDDVLEFVEVDLSEEDSIGYKVKVDTDSLAYIDAFELELSEDDVYFYHYDSKIRKFLEEKLGFKICDICDVYRNEDFEYEVEVEKQTWDSPGGTWIEYNGKGITVEFYCMVA